MTDWPIKTLGEVCELVNGATPDTKVKEYWGGKHAWITPAEMGGLDSPFISMSRRTLSDKGLASCSATMVPPKTVILSSRAPIGHLVINEVPMATNQGCKSLIPKDGLDFSFLYYYLKANVEVLESLGTGTTFKELSGTQLKTVEIPVPPLEEQKRIVVLLDASTARVTELTACYEQARTHANNLFTSALRDALESNPDWPVKTLGDLLEVSIGGIWGSEAGEDEVDVFVYRSTELIKDGQLKEELTVRRSITARQLDSRKLEEGDLLLEKSGGGPKTPVGRVGLVKVLLGLSVCSNFMQLMRPRKKEVLPVYLHYFLNHFHVAGYTEDLQNNSTNIRNLKTTEYMEVEIPVPPLEEQKRIVARLDSMRAKTSEMVAAYDAKLTAAKNLRQSILESAFAGDL